MSRDESFGERSIVSAGSHTLCDELPGKALPDHGGQDHYDPKGQTPTRDRKSFFKDENTQGSVLWYIAFYQKRAPGRRLAFRASVFILLFLCISLPFITQVSPQQWQPQIASGLAWVIALVAA